MYVHCARPSFTTNTSGRPSRSITARDGTMRRPGNRVASSCTSAYMPGRRVPSPCTRTIARPARVTESTSGNSASTRPRSNRPGAPALLMLASPPTRTKGKSCSSTCASMRRLRVSTTVSSACPALTFSPAEISMASTVPFTGLRIVARSCSYRARSRRNRAPTKPALFMSALRCSGVGPRPVTTDSGTKLSRKRCSASSVLAWASRTERSNGYPSKRASTCPLVTAWPGRTTSCATVPATSARSFTAASERIWPVVVTRSTRSPSRASSAVTGSASAGRPASSAASCAAVAVALVESVAAASPLLQATSASATNTGATACRPNEGRATDREREGVRIGGERSETSTRGTRPRGTAQH